MVLSGIFVAKVFSGSNTITHSGILKHFKNVEPHEALSELIWNGFDAGANEVRVTIKSNDAGGTQSVQVIDDGKGINFQAPEQNFRRFNDSLKKDSYDTHGSHGRGRLAFHKICHSAVWYTRFQGDDARIRVVSSNLSDIDGTTIPASDQHHSISNIESGTCVELSDFDKNLPDVDALTNEFRKIFGAHLALMPDRKLILNGEILKPQDHSLHEFQIKIRGVDFQITLLHWNEKPGTEKSYIHIITFNNKILYKYHSSLNRKKGYYTSIYVKSELFDRFSADRHDLGEPIDSFLTSDRFRILNKEIGAFAKRMYAEFLIGQAEKHVERFEADGDFPEYPELDSTESEWRLSHLKDIVRAVLVRDPSLLVGHNKKQRRLIIRLLDKLAVSNENSGIFEVFESILNLDAASMTALAHQLKKTKLDNIINTIEILQNRELAISQLKEIMDVHYAEVLETPDLQRVIENNTWLFGAAYEILGAEEDTFTQVAANLRSSIAGIEDIDVGDLAEGVTVEGAKKQVDLLLVRKTPQIDSHNRKYFRCVLVEIKRPGVSLNDKHLNQLDRYASILSKYPAFNSDLTKFELLLVGRTISADAFGIQQRLDTSKVYGEPGLVTVTDKVKTYIKTWPRIFDEFNLTNDYLLEKLKTQRADLTTASKDELLAELTKA